MRHVTHDEQAKVTAAGCVPMFMFTHKVVDDDQRRFKRCDWGKSSMGTASNDGSLLATWNTVYVVPGSGHRKVSINSSFFLPI